jgi:FkbM family methyltransferase
MTDRQQTQSPEAKRVFIAVPVYRAAEASFIVSLMTLLSRPPEGLDFTLRILPGDSLVTRARNTLTAWFLESDATHLLWLDSDLVFSPEMIARLCSHDEPVVAGMYPLKTDTDGTIEWCLNALPGAVKRPDGLKPVRYAGTGAMLISRDVFRKMVESGHAAPYYPGAEKLEVHYDFWNVGVFAPDDSPGRYLSEDWYFCEWCQQLKIPVLVDTQTIFRHVGQEAYPTQRQMDGLAAGLTRVERNGVCLVVTQGAASTAASVLAGEYSADLPQAPCTVLDCGANEGAFTAWARAQWPEASVEAYEPIPENAERFRANHWRDPKVRLTVAAVGDASEFRLGKNSCCCARDDRGDQRDVFIPVASVLPQTVPPCEFVKVDCEGMELEILAGLDLSATRAVAVEYHSAEDASAIGGLLHSLGFTLQREAPYQPGWGVLIFVRKP